MLHVCFALQSSSVFFQRAHARCKNFVCSDLEAEPAVQIGKLRAELAQNGHGFLPWRAGAVNLARLRFRKVHGPEGLIFETQLVRLFAGGIICASKREHAGISLPGPSLAQVAAGLIFAACKAGYGKTDRLPPIPYFLSAKLKIKQKKGG